MFIQASKTEDTNDYSPDLSAGEIYEVQDSSVGRLQISRYPFVTDQPR